ncbi:Heparanase-like protein 3 [Forsythia ovata]|uniref:Heparanase-like protein 3 n=1 Tax=Forsythia ovata TaxID=205694 RepID=A0ABD1SIV6_9LAMI
MGWCFLACLFSFIFISVYAQNGKANVTVKGTVFIDSKNPIASTSSNFICATLDWWPPEKCDYGTCSWANSSLALIVFGLNALNGKSILPNSSAVGAWNSSNAASLIRYTVKKGYNIYGWELGNELCGTGVGVRVAADDYAVDTIALNDIIYYAYRGLFKPLTIAPGGFFEPDWFGRFIALTENTLDVVTQHIYNLGPGVDEHIIEKIVNPSYLADGAGLFIQLQDTLKRSETSTTAWVGESGGAYNSGRNHQGITLLLINLDSNTTVQATVDFNGTSAYVHGHRRTVVEKHHCKEPAETIREEYHLTPKDGNIQSQTVLLNGKPLIIDSSGAIPALDPMTVPSSKPITIVPRSIVFVHMPNVSLPACMQVSG